MAATHAATFNGSVTIDVTDDFRPLKEQIRFSLAKLDGVNQVSYLLFERLPSAAGEDPDDAEEFLQSAGTAEAMTIEIRRLDGDGEYRLYAVGRAEDADVDAVEVEWDGNRQTVPANEVFAADEAAGIYWYYYQHHAIPPEYTTRQFDLN